MREKKTIAKKSTQSAAKKTKAKVQKFGRGKKYLEASKLREAGKAYSLEEAIGLVQKTSTTNFPATVEAHIRLGIDTQQAGQGVRGAVSLPHGLGKEKKILVFALGKDQSEAKKAGADYVGGEELIEKVNKGFTDFDVVLATPEIMSQVGKLGKILGTKGMMPNPKSGTVAADIAKAVGEFKKGKVEFRMDKEGALHVPIGKVNMTSVQLLENFKALYEAVLAAKPAKAKGVYIKSINLASTMGLGIKVDPSSI